ncbi:MAG: winged helix-turn-helix domain-containing protein [Lachnospiraceae bacterium]|nr:winged helix-turn-helix domain-containing protein [Lachnospiraceae bacterium]
MAVPKYDELMKPFLVAVKDGKVYKIKDVASKLAEQLNLSEDDLAELLPSKRQTVFKNRVGWAKTYLKKAGLLDSPARASVIITEQGKKVVAENPEKINAKYLERFPSFVEFVSSTTSQNKNNAAADAMSKMDLTPDDQLEDAYKQINANLASDLLSEVLKIEPHMFESFVFDLLLKMGYGAVEYGSRTTSASGDDGIDGIIMEDKLGFSLIYMQAKKWALDQVVGQPEIQSFVGAITGKHGNGLFVTTARFSHKAVEYAKVHHIILIDGTRLANLMIENDFCVSTQKVFKIKTMDTDALAKYQDE